MSKVIKGTKTLSERVARALLWVFTGAIPVFIAACYGPSEGFGPDGGWENEVPARGKVVNGLTMDPIRDIRVSCVRDGYEYDSTYTMPGDGAFELWYVESQPCDTLLFRDVDGEDNGSYQEMEIPFVEANGDVTVELDQEG